MKSEVIRIPENRKLTVEEISLLRCSRKMESQKLEIFCLKSTMYGWCHDVDVDVDVRQLA